MHDSLLPSQAAPHLDVWQRVPAPQQLGSKGGAVVQQRRGALPAGEGGQGAQEACLGLSYCLPCFPSCKAAWEQSAAGQIDAPRLSMRLASRRRVQPAAKTVAPSNPVLCLWCLYVQPPPSTLPHDPPPTCPSRAPTHLASWPYANSSEVNSFVLYASSRCGPAASSRSAACEGGGSTEKDAGAGDTVQRRRTAQRPAGRQRQCRGGCWCGRHSAGQVDRT